MEKENPAPESAITNNNMPCLAIHWFDFNMQQRDVYT